MIVKPDSKTNKVTKTAPDKVYPGKPISETITNGFFSVDQQWTVKYWNKAAEKLLGVTAKDIVGKNLWERFAGILPVEFYAIYQKAFLQDIPIHFEEYWGEMGTWSDVITYHCDDTLSVSFKSSNLREEPDLQLKTLSELYRFVTEVTNDCLWEWDLQAKEIFWIDGGHKRVFGYQIENALIPQSFWESCLHPEDKERVLEKLNKTIRDGSCSVWEDEYRFQKADGSYAYVHDRGQIIYDNDKVASRMIGATQDINSRKITEKKLLEAEKKLSLVARQTPNAVIITDAREKITWVNSAFTRITEYGQEEVMGMKLWSFLQGKESYPSTVKYLKEKIKDKQPFDYETIIYNKSDIKHWLHVQGQALLDENENFEGYFVTETDITEKILQENKLVQERLTKQKEVTDIVLMAQENERAVITRELQENLNQILCVAKLYVEMAKNDEEKRPLFLTKSSDFIEDVIKEIRSISKTLAAPGVNSRGLFDSINILLNDLLLLYPVKIEFHVEGIDEEDLGEKLQLNIFRIVQEQLNNILKYSKATRVDIHLTKHANEIILLISDNGEGTHFSKEKNGVSNINIKSRVELYSGMVTIISKPVEGYQLKVVLPLNIRI
jgi:PAS domain S-box-containing protein